MSKRDFLALTDFSRQEIQAVIDSAISLKGGGGSPTALAGKTLAMIFAKSSTRTRVSFETGMYQLGGHALFLSAREMQLGRGEPIRDTARVLSRYVNGIMIRTFAHADVEEFASHASVPVVNGLTDLLHPCQVLADMMTVQEEYGGLEGRIVAWIGDGNNMANSWINAAAVMGMELRLACPSGYEPDASILTAAQRKTTVRVVREPAEAMRGAEVINTDVWASMGQEEEAAERVRAFQGFTVDRGLMKLASPDAIFLHCLPVHRGEEVTEEVFEGSQTRVFDQAENRLHAQKALLLRLLG